MGNSVGKAIRSIKKNGLEPIYFLLGNDFFLQNFFIKNIKKTFKGTDLTKYLDLNDNNDLILLFNDLKTVSMFSSGNIFVLRNFNNISKSNQNLLQQYLNNPTTDNILIFILNDFKISNKVSKNISSKSFVVDIQTPFNKNKIKEWVNYYVKLNDMSISYSSLDFLVNSYSDDMQNIINEIEKKYLYNASKDIDIVSEDDQYYTRQFKIWNLIDAVGNKNLKQSITIYNKLLFDGVSLIPILINLTNFFIHLISNKNAEFIINKIITSKLTKYNKNYQQDEVCNIILELRNMDVLIKSTSIKDEMFMTLFLIKICKGHFNE